MELYCIAIGVGCLQNFKNTRIMEYNVVQVKATNRDLKFDGLKFIMIFLVVLGHLGCNDYVDKVIYSFHMPVFIFLSGFFTSLSANDEKQNKWLKKTLIIYAVAQITAWMLKIGLGLSTDMLKGRPLDTSVISWKVLISPELALWYLVCLMYYRLAIWKVLIKIDDIKLLVISVVLSLFSGLIPIDHDFAFQRAFAFFPFFALGIVFKKRKLIDQLERIPMAYAVIALLVGLIVARFFPLYMPKFHYDNWHQPVWRIIQSGLGLYLCLLIVRISRIKFTEKFASYGEHTLWIYIGHTYLITIGEKAFPYLGIHFNLFTAILLTIVYCAFFIFLSNLYGKMKK